MTDTQKTPQLTQEEALASLERYEYGWADSDVAGANAKRGLTEEVVRDISARKDEPEWMLQRRLRGHKLFGRKPMPNWGADLTGIDFDNIKYYVEASEKQAGLVISGKSVDSSLVEMVELADHPWFVACQFHPEFTSTPRDGHPLFTGFVNAALEHKTVRTRAHSSQQE